MIRLGRAEDRYFTLPTSRIAAKCAGVGTGKRRPFGREEHSGGRHLFDDGVTSVVGMTVERRPKGVRRTSSRGENAQAAR